MSHRPEQKPVSLLTPPSVPPVLLEGALDPGPESNRRVDHQRRNLIGSLLIGKSAAIRAVLDQLRIVAPKDTTVLITGETGTGKERVSRAIHLLSGRHEQEMVSVNCAGVPATLLEDEFFGHVKGAFTDARTGRAGRFEQAHGSTLFLDEIGDLPLELQPKLLRALQEREIHRIGGTNAIQFDTRVIAATNVDLWRRVEDGRFREDLYYRINVFPIHLPPLRERREDIPEFIRHFLDRFCQRDGVAPKRLSSGAEEVLMGRPWRGNIRELENAVEMAVIRSQDREEVTAADFPEPRDAQVNGSIPGPAALRDGIDLKTLVARYERDLIRKALDLARGNKNKAASILGLKRTTLIEKLKRME
jgi:transcriptional regulator with GAF, ATPase, and Fis domain